MSEPIIPKRRRATPEEVSEAFNKQSSPSFDQIKKTLTGAKDAIVDAFSDPKPRPIPVVNPNVPPKELDNPLPYHMVRDLAGTDEGMTQMKELRKLPVNQQEGRFMQIMEQMKRKKQGL